MLGERMDVTPPSMSSLPTPAPASGPVTRSRLPLTVVPSCMGAPSRLVSWGSPGVQRPVIALSEPKGLRLQPRSLSKSSKKTNVGAGVWGGGGVNVGVGVGVALGVEVDVGVGVFVGVSVGVGVARRSIG